MLPGAPHQVGRVAVGVGDVVVGIAAVVKAAACGQMQSIGALSTRPVIDAIVAHEQRPLKIEIKPKRVANAGHYARRSVDELDAACREAYCHSIHAVWNQRSRSQSGYGDLPRGGLSYIANRADDEEYLCCAVRTRLNC